MMMTHRRRFTQTLLAGSAWAAAGGPLVALAQQGMEAQSSSPDQLAAWLKADADQWRGIVQEIGFRADS